MDDLLSLDYSHQYGIHLTGIDLDHQSLELSQKNASRRTINNVRYIQKDACMMDDQEDYDIITSNGLNIYEANDDRVIHLYKQFYKALKKEGILVTSFLTPPPTVSKESTWRSVHSEDALKQKAIFNDIIGVNWNVFRTECTMHHHLKLAGFKILDVIYDSQGIFPTVVAKKQ